MVNWRENVEFFYVLFILLSGIGAFFAFYEQSGIQIAGVAVFIVVVIETIIGLAVFETDRAIAKWKKLTEGHSTT
jgi:hypothetical protein